MKNILLILIIIVFALVQSSIPAINLVLLFCFAMFVYDASKAPLFFFSGGLILDLLGSGRFGYFVLVMCLISVGLQVCKRFLGGNLILKLAYLTVSIFFFYFLLGNFRYRVLFANLAFFAVMVPFVSWVNGFFKQKVAIFRRN